MESQGILIGIIIFLYLMGMMNEAMWGFETRLSNNQETETVISAIFWPIIVPVCLVIFFYKLAKSK